MSRTCFCRVVQFRAKHHYWDRNKTEAQNHALFGEAAQPHEHLWTLTIWLTGPVNQYGMMVNLPAVDHVLKTSVTDIFDNNHINRADPWFQNHQPTTEVLADYFASRLAPQFDAELVKLRISESNDLFSEWTRTGGDP